MDVFRVLLMDRGFAGDRCDLKEVGEFLDVDVAKEYCKRNTMLQDSPPQWQGDLYKVGLTYGNYSIQVVPVAVTADLKDIEKAISAAAVEVLQKLKPGDIDALRRANVTIPDGLLASM